MPRSYPDMAKPKQFARPPKKPRAKPAPETPDEFQEAADLEEETGGKWRAGDTAKSGRAFVRALEIYDQGLQRFPTNFDLAYNKARLQLEITQQPALVSHVGLPLLDLLQQTLQSHRYALRLNDDYADLLFNTSQVLTSLAEHFSERAQSSQAVPLLHETLELLSSCLAKQEMLLEQQQLDVPEADDDGGVAVDEPYQASSIPNTETEERTATIIAPVTPSDLIDTAHASLSALTTLVSLVDENALGNLGDMAQTLTDVKGPAYVSLMSTEQKAHSHFALLLDRANFVAAFANAQFNFHVIGLQTYLDRLRVFEQPGGAQHINALSSEAEARTELVLSAFDQMENTNSFPAADCWKQLTSAQDLLTQASNLSDAEAKEQRAKTFKTKGDIELLRFRLATMPVSSLSESIRTSAGTLLKNARTYYKGALSHAKSIGDDDFGQVASRRLEVVKYIMSVPQSEAQHAASTAPGAVDLPPITEELSELLLEVADEGLVDSAMIQRVIEQLR